MDKPNSNSEIKDTILSILQRIRQKSETQITDNNGEEIYYLTLALREVNSVRATIPKDFF